MVEARVHVELILYPTLWYTMYYVVPTRIKDPQILDVLSAFGLCHKY